MDKDVITPRSLLRPFLGATSFTGLEKNGLSVIDEKGHLSSLKHDDDLQNHIISCMFMT